MILGFSKSSIRFVLADIQVILMGFLDGNVGGLNLGLGQRRKATYYILRRISPLKYENPAPLWGIAGNCNIAAALETGRIVTANGRYTYYTVYRE